MRGKYSTFISLTFFRLFNVSSFVNYRSRPTHVVLSNGNLIKVLEIIPHPSYNHSISPFYNNIAVMKLQSFGMIEPFCGWYGDPKPDQKLLITGSNRIPIEKTEGMVQQR